MSDSYIKIKHDKDAVIRTEVVLRDAAPNATYNVFVIQVIADDSGGIGTALDCQQLDGTVSTDKHGKGKIKLTEGTLEGSDFFHVYAFTFDNSGIFHSYDTRLIAL